MQKNDIRRYLNKRCSVIFVNNSAIINGRILRVINRKHTMSGKQETLVEISPDFEPGDTFFYPTDRIDEIKPIREPIDLVRDAV